MSTTIQNRVTAGYNKYVALSADLNVLRPILDTGISEEHKAGLRKWIAEIETELRAAYLIEWLTARPIDESLWSDYVYDGVNDPQYLPGVSL